MATTTTHMVLNVESQEASSASDIDVPVSGDATSPGCLQGQDWVIAGAYARPRDVFRPLEKARLAVRELATLETDWDGEGSLPPSPRVAAVAERLLLDVAQRFGSHHGVRVRPSVVAPIPGGGIYLEWRAAHAELQVDVLPEGQFGLLFIDRGGERPRYEETDDAALEDILEGLGQVLEEYT